MTWSLLRKEIWHHWLAFSIAAVLTISCGAVLFGVSLARGQAGTPFEGYRLFLAVFGVVLSIVVCHRLVVLEYQGRTQLFLEALPFARWRMLAIKYCLGLAITLALMALMFAVCLLVAARHDPASPRFTAIAGLRAVSYLWCAYNFFFVMGLLGRYRAAIYIALGFVVLGLQEISALEFSRFGPFALVDNRFAYEADDFPWRELRDTWYLGLACLGAATLLGLVREGSVAALLAEKMSHREKVFISALLVGLLWTVTLVAEKAKRVAFDLPDALTESSPGILVKVARPHGDAGLAAAKNLAREVAAELAQLKDYLGATELPPVFITSRQDLDPGRYERGELEHHHGLHVQLNFESPGWQVRDFMSWLSRETIVLASNARAKHESRRFVLDGFPVYWSHLHETENSSSPDSKLWLRALHGTKDGVALADLSRWLSFRERVGDPIASAVAWSALRSLARLCATNDFRRFIRATLAVGAPRDLRSVLGDGGEPWNRAMKEIAHVPLDRFYRAWQEDLAAAQRDHGPRLASIPRIQAEVRVSGSSSLSRQVFYSLSLSPVPVNSTGIVTFMHQTLPPYDDELDERDLLREKSTLSAASDRELPGGYSRHQRLCYTGAYESPELGCQIISGWKRVELR